MASFGLGAFRSKLNRGQAHGSAQCPESCRTDDGPHALLLRQVQEVLSTLEATSWLGGRPNLRVYSRLNWLGLS